MTEVAAAPGVDEKVDAVWGEPENWEAAGWHWGRLPAVRRMINRQVTGSDGLEPIVWFLPRAAQTHGAPLGRVLVLACGSGHLERMLVQSGWARDVVAVDLSPRVLALAAATAQAEGLTGITYRQGDMNRLEIDGPFDAVFSVAAIHHCAELEALYAVIRRVLVPGGWFYVDEYVGPNRFQWPDSQVLQVNRLLQVLPDRFVHNTAGFSRRGFHRVSAREVADFDPSEAVRSVDILPLLREAFDVEVCRGYGGRLLHLALANLAQNFDPVQSGDPTGPAYLDLVIAMAEQWRIRDGHDDFAVAIARLPRN